jgi:hypothetical protein
VIQSAGLLGRTTSYKHKQYFWENYMGMVMVKCPRTGRAIPTGIETDHERFQRCTVFFARTRCPICHTEHAWFAQDAWVNQPRSSTYRRRSSAPVQL